MSPTARSPQDEFDHCIGREKSERAAAHAATDPAVRSSHLIMAERYADRAWSLSETHDLTYVPSGLWQKTVPESARPSPTRKIGRARE